METYKHPVGDLPDEHVSNKGPEQQYRRHKRGHSPGYWLAFAVLVSAAAVLVYFVGYVPRHREQQEAERSSHTQSTEVPRVRVLKVNRAPAASELMIPGTTLASTEAYIYARASGYVSKRYADIGDRVHTGQLLASIDAPDLDKQVEQARSALQQSESTLGQLEAQLHLASVTWDRYKVLVGRGVFSRQDGDTQEANFRVAEANLRAAQDTVRANRDNLERLIVLQQYERVTAPFGGVITARNIDVGALISAQGSGLGSSPTAGPGSSQAALQAANAGASGALSSAVAPQTGGAQGGQMFAMASIDPLRILVSVPEAYSSLVRVGDKANLSFQQLPDEKVVGKVTRTSGSIDLNTRTLLVEVQARNPKGRLLPGMYVVVNFVQLHGQPPLLVPGESIVVRDQKTTVAVVDRDSVVHFRPIQIGRDYGDQSEITGGLQPGEVIAETVTDDVREGKKVRPEFQPSKHKQPEAQSDKEAAESGRYGNQSLANHDESSMKANQKGGGQKGRLRAGQKKQ
jgi:multidrug efflux pump subunit AcrA (membrane-fusion protein)